MLNYRAIFDASLQLVVKRLIGMADQRNVHIGIGSYRPIITANIGGLLIKEF